MATLHVKGKLLLEQDFRHEGVLGTIFTGRLIEKTRVGQYEAMVPTLSPKASRSATAGDFKIGGRHQF
jgi:proline racemase